MFKRYRKRIGRFEEWHFHMRCRYWPEANYIEQIALPPDQELCLECQELSNARPEPDPRLSGAGLTTLHPYRHSK